MRPVHLPATTSPQTFIQSSVPMGQESFILCTPVHVGFFRTSLE